MAASSTPEGACLGAFARLIWAWLVADIWRSCHVTQDSRTAARNAGGSAAETASLRAERLETNMKVRDLEQDR